MPVEDDATLREILHDRRSIAVLGIKAGPRDEACQVPAYMQAQGYRILGVNPKLARALGAPCAARLADLAEPVDLVNVFRAPRHIPGHVDELLAMDPLPRTVWLQLGIRHDASAARLEAADVQVVQDRCILVEHRRLLAAAAPDARPDPGTPKG